MIISTRFVRRDTGEQVEFNTDDMPPKLPITEWTTEVDIRSADRTKQRRHGIWRASPYLGKRIMRYQGDILGVDSDDYIAQRLHLNGVMMPSIFTTDPVIGDLYILFDGMTEEVSQACTIESWTEIPVQALSPSRSSYLVAFKLFEPWMLGAEQILTLTPSTTEEGRIYNKTYNKDYATSSALPNSGSLFNSGNAETFPILKFYGPSVSPGATLLSLGRYYYFTLEDLTIGESDVVTVDLEARTVERNTGENLYEFAEGDWWALGRGNNRIRYSAWESQPTSKLEVVWKNAYML